MTELEEYYNKFSEDKRLTRRHGNVEYVVSMHYIHKYLDVLKGQTYREGMSVQGRERAVEDSLDQEKTSLDETLTAELLANGSSAAGALVYESSGKQQIKILDLGAGTGRYSIALAEEGYDVTALELVRYNLGMLKKKSQSVKAFQGNALDLSRFNDQEFDLTLVFGPLYHLYTVEDKVRVLEEARRVTKPTGYIMAAYCMNEYGVLLYGFRDGHVKECLADGRLTEDFQCKSQPRDLYDYVRLEQIDELNRRAGLVRQQIIAADGPANYMRRTLNAMDEETYELFIRYQLSVCERPDLLGASAHTVDILSPFTK